jgi:hypothetical protein
MIWSETDQMKALYSDDLKFPLYVQSSTVPRRPASVTLTSTYPYQNPPAPSAEYKSDILYDQEDSSQDSFQTVSTPISTYINPPPFVGGYTTITSYFKEFSPPLTIKNITADGNCFYGAVYYQLMGKEGSSEQVHKFKGSFFTWIRETLRVMADDDIRQWEQIRHMHVDHTKDICVEEPSV